MNILIVYTTAGFGHRRAAEALHKVLLKETNFQVKIIDALDYTNFLFKFIYARGYNFLISYLPTIWGLFFYLTSCRFLNRLNFYLRLIINSFNSARLKEYLLKENPDVVISTHFFPGFVVSQLKQDGLAVPKLISVITDFCFHPFWISNCIDTYIVATQATRDGLITKGVSPDKIRVLGIPVDPGFLRSQNRQILSQKFSLNQDIFTVLILTGTVGIGPLEKLVSLLSDDIQILVICGKNKRLFKRLKIKQSRNLKVFGLIDYVQELMAVSDILVTKPGGLTISEALICKLPMLFLPLVPGQEGHNARILCDYKAAKIIQNLDQLKNLISRYKDSKSELQQMMQAQEAIRRPNAAVDIVNLLKDYEKSPLR